MESARSPSPNESIGISTPSTTSQYNESEAKNYICPGTATIDGTVEDSPSSPFLSTVNDASESIAPLDQENISPPKSRPISRVLSGTELSPLKILAERPDVRTNRTDSSRDSVEDLHKPSHTRGSSFNLKKGSRPDNRFPIKVSPPAPAAAETPTRATPPSRSPLRTQQISLETVIQENHQPRTEIDIFEDDGSIMRGTGDVMDNESASPCPCPGQTLYSAERPHQLLVDETTPIEGDDTANMDDTIISTLSTFSAVPSMTMFARMGNSPIKTNALGSGMTPRGPFAASLRGGHSPTKTTEGQVSGRNVTGDDATSLLLDFSEQVGKCGSSRISPTKSMATGNITSTPRRRVSNLIDFELPPMPTPRSIPTVTPRELESLKSNFLSEISSLRASLSGKEAEASSLKTAVADAEKRVGECMEELRDLRGEREVLVSEKEAWERRGREMEKVLRDVQEEIVRSQRDREELESKFLESEQRREAAEMMAQDAESKMAGIRAGKASADSHHATSPGRSSTDGIGKSEKDRTAQEVEMAVERVARELHALYKSKHETKVAALKKSYENRWERRVKELESRLQVLGHENDELRERHNTMNTFDIEKLERWEKEIEERKEQHARDQVEIKHLGAEVRKLEAVVGERERDNEALREMLEKERVEKGELVILAEELMSMQQSFIVHDESNNDGSQEDIMSEEQYGETMEEEPQLRQTPNRNLNSYGSNTVTSTQYSRPQAQQAQGIQRTPAPVRGLPAISQRQSLAMATPGSSRASKPNGGGGGGVPHSVGRLSGLRAPGSTLPTGGSRIGGPSIGRGGGMLPRGGGVPRSGIMSSIEKMGK